MKQIEIGYDLRIFLTLALGTICFVAYLVYSFESQKAHQKSFLEMVKDKELNGS